MTNPIIYLREIRTKIQFFSFDEMQSKCRLSIASNFVSVSNVLSFGKAYLLCYLQDMHFARKIILVVLHHLRTRGTIDSSVTWKKVLKQLAHLMRYNRIICQIMWNSNHKHEERIHTMVFEAWFCVNPWQIKFAFW